MKSSLSWKAAQKLLTHLQHGQLIIKLDEQQFVYGDLNNRELIAEATIHNEQVLTDMLTGGALAAAEGYIRGDWDSPNLTNVVRLFAKNLQQNQSNNRPLAALKQFSAAIFHWLNRNSLMGSKRNIEAHYDLGNDLFESFLDDTMMYSSAIYPHETATLEEAQLYRLNRICQKLHLTKDSHLLEIGTGWGGLAIHAAQKYGCRVTTTTISEDQYAYAEQKISELDLTDKITLLKQDYRKLEGTFDRVVSIEMIEAVGHRYLPGYFQKIDSLLESDGIALLQCITMPDQRYRSYKQSVDFIRKYIFPGGHLPSISEIHNQIAQKTNMTVNHFEDISQHYARTLHDWNDRFQNNYHQLPKDRYNQQFYRMWRYYFAYCEGGFKERAIGTSQIIFSKSRANQNWQVS